jgi:ribosomal protein L11 methyltransferase
VLDVGTGSGILAIAAAKLGAADVQGLDVDADALESAQTAAAMNGTVASMSFRQGDFRQACVGPAHIVLANLTGSMLAASVEPLLACVAPGGHLILSGITTAEAPMVLDAYQSVTTTVWRGDEGGWVGLLLRIYSRAQLS